MSKKITILAIDEPISKYFVSGLQKIFGDLFLLKLIYWENQRGSNTGRRSLTNIFNQIYYEISEVQIRSIKEELSRKGCIEKRAGRKSTTITDKGINCLYSLGKF